MQRSPAGHTQWSADAMSLLLRANHTTGSAGAPLSIIESGPITHAQVCLHHSRCSYTDSLRRLS